MVSCIMIENIHCVECGSLPKFLHSSCVHSSPSHPDLLAAPAVVTVHLTSFFKTPKNFSPHATSSKCSAATVSKQPPHHTSSCPYKKKNLSSLVTVSREMWARPVTQASHWSMEWWSLLAFQKETKELRFVRKMQLRGSRTRMLSVNAVLLNFFFYSFFVHLLCTSGLLSRRVTSTSCLLYKSHASPCGEL